MKVTRTYDRSTKDPASFHQNLQATLPPDRTDRHWFRLDGHSWAGPCGSTTPTVRGDPNRLSLGGELDQPQLLPAWRGGRGRSPMPSPMPGLRAARMRPEYRPLSRTELLLILGFWILIGILTSANYLIEPRGHGPWQPLVPFATTLVTFSNSLMWCAVTPAIIWVASRLPLERTRWPTRLMFVVIGLVLAIVIDLATSFVRQHLFYPPLPCRRTCWPCSACGGCGS